MRKGFDGLSAEVAHALKRILIPRGVHFQGKRGDYLKILTWTAPDFVYSPSGSRKANSFGPPSLMAR